MEVKLLPNNEVKLSAKAIWGEKTIPVSLRCVLGIGKRRRVKFEEVKFDNEIDNNTKCAFGILGMKIFQHMTI